MKVSRKRGRLRLELDDVEIEVLAGLFTELAEAVGATDPDDPVVQRLYPAAYPDDDAAADEYREMTETGLRDDRLARIDACTAELALGGPVDLDDPDVATRWIKVLNDLRLALGTRLGITEGEPEPDLDDPQGRPRVLYHWLTAVQDSVVVELMR